MREGEWMNDDLNYDERVKVLEFLKDQVSKLFPRRINNTMLYHDVQISDCGFGCLGFKITITVYNTEILKLRDKFFVVFNSSYLNLVPTEERERFITDCWIKNVSDFLVRLIIGINTEDLTQLKKELEDLNKW